MGFLALLYGLVSYVVFLASFLYAIGFVSNQVVPKAIDSGAAGPLGQALLINALLLGLFAVQHNVMARPWFKRAWTRVVPQSIERSTYVLFSSLILFLLYWQWQPMPETVWSIENAAGRAVLWGICALGWLTVLFSTFIINHWDLFGLRQVYLRSRGAEYTQLHFVKKSLYHFVRHPLLLGFIIAFWATPEMSQGHLMFAAVTTIWIVLSIRFEESDLVKHHGDDYREYQKQVSMLIPFPKDSG